MGIKVAGRGRVNHTHGEGFLKSNVYNDICFIYVATLFHVFETRNLATFGRLSKSLVKLRRLKGFLTFRHDLWEFRGE